MNETQAFFIVNPHSAGGKTKKDWEHIIKPAILSKFPNANWSFTSGIGDASELAMVAKARGAELIVAVGGDGLVNEVVNGLMNTSLSTSRNKERKIEGLRWESAKKDNTTSILGVIPRGTGCDFARSLGVPKNLEQALDVLSSGKTVLSDIGKIAFLDHDKKSSERYFINIAGCGGNGDVVHRVNKTGKKLGGFLSFFIASLQSTLNYIPPIVDIIVDGQKRPQFPLQVLFVCNAIYCGGGMLVGTRAKINDSRFFIVEVKSISKMTSLLEGSKLYTGSIEKMAGTTTYSCKKIEVLTPGILLDSDGEQPGTTPASYEIVENAIHIRAASNAKGI